MTEPNVVREPSTNTLKFENMSFLTLSYESYLKKKHLQSPKPLYSDRTEFKLTIDHIIISAEHKFFDTSNTMIVEHARV